jgi:arylsulfatase A-like enzyme
MRLNLYARRWLPLGARLGLAALSAAGCGRSPADGRSAAAPRQVIMIVLDAARPDRFSCYGYHRQTTPHQDALAQQGFICRNHFSQGTGTRAALPTLLYSRYFAKPLFPASPFIPLAEPQDLFRRPDAECISFTRVLADAGFLTATISAHPWIKAGTRFADEFGELHDLANVRGEDQVYPDAQQIVDYAINWLGQNRERDFLLYLHFMDTHLPHHYDPDAQHYFGETLYSGDRFTPDGAPKDLTQLLSAEDRRYLDALYDGSLRYNDRELGRLFAYLEDQGCLHETLIMITADHGEHLLEVTGRFGHQGLWYDRVARIPLIVYYPPKLAPTQVMAPTAMVDVMPTLLDLLEVPLPAGKSCDGRSIVAQAATDSERRQYALIRGAIRDRQFKCIFQTPDEVLLAAAEPPLDSVAGLLYDGRSDPLETKDLWAARPDEVLRLLRVYRAEMMGRYERFNSALTVEQPKVPFAIGTNHMRIEPELSVVARRPRANDCDQSEQGDGWLRSKHEHKFWLLARRGADPCQIEIPLPSGRYILSAQVMGQGELVVGENETALSFAGEAFDPGDYARPTTVQLGDITIEDELFRASLHPRGDGGCLYLRMLGFTPVFAAADTVIDETLDRERIERLRALGYVD